MINVLRFEIFIGLSIVATGLEQQYTIYRTANEIGDKFDIPSKLCSNSNVSCGNYGANPRGGEQCRCLCPPTRPTFKVNGSSWSCVDDRKIKLNEGMYKLRTSLCSALTQKALFVRLSKTRMEITKLCSRLLEGTTYLTINASYVLRNFCRKFSLPTPLDNGTSRWCKSR